ncbi:unnamed protein product [Moneuplotes crassus]|uniref:Amino acid transporter transmembrane domain-containing protein n=1 Tax=Euplotes crassus TaxID=5936 RepID=A0AAD1X6K6_EUPCR|nr:unnamed protein product [Moneuplotes crassus]
MDKRRGPIMVPRESPHYHRMRYYSAIRKGLKHMSQSTTYLDVPTHVIDDNAFIIFQTGREDPHDRKHSSLSTIFSIWNTMVGSGLFTIPWAFSNSGIVLGLIISFITFAISYYTCSIYVRLARNDSDFADTMYKYFGKKGWVVTMIFSILLMFSVIVIYYELMSQALFPVIAALIEWGGASEVSLDMGLDLSRFSLFYTCIALTLILYPVVSKRDISMFIRLNSFGIIFVCFILIYILAYGFYSLSNTTFEISNEESDLEGTTRNISLFRNKFNNLAGMMTLGYYIHNVCISIVKENKHPENNTRDVFIGYFLVFLSYSLVGSLGYLGFSGYTFKANIRETENLLYMFSATDMLAFVIRIICFCQMFSVYPMLFCVIRNQFGTIFYQGRELSNDIYLAFNATLLIVATIIGATFPKVGSILGYVGGFIGLGLIYIIPISLFLKRYKLQIEDPNLVEALDNNTVRSVKRKNPEFSPKLVIEESSTSSPGKQDIVNQTSDMTLQESLLQNGSYKTYKKSFLKFYLLCVIHAFIVLIGIIILALQFLSFEEW